MYNVLKEESDEGTYAKKYTSTHQDSYDNSGTKDIYYFYAKTSGSVATQLQDRNNVIFANHCWKMIRTTDTGGVKILYNGEVEDGKCLSTRGTHEGYGMRTTQDLQGNYYYGSSYTMHLLSFLL